MRRTLNPFILLLFAIPFLGCQKKKVAYDVPTWFLSMVEDSKNTGIETDFSNILSDKRVPYIGFIGSNYQKLKIDILNVQKKDDNLYDVTGVSVVKGNRCNFHGTIDVIENREFNHPTYGVDDSMKGKFKRRGCSIAKYRFEEDSNQRGSGVFSGYLFFYWYETHDNKIVYDDIDDHSDSYCNNQYVGTWQGNKTKKSKPCAWGQYRIPNSGDLDIGAAEFSVNPKYSHNGWEKE
ncbi:MAG: hypothetical protein ACTTI4_06355 [Prevotella fusca]|uniref:hypothetical protein n=1 Tax=Prevotella fusca TaxID=589436 RepID=UPI003F9F7433